MKILLINSNPVVTRLFALCTRGEHISLDEVEHLDELEGVTVYDLLFVDDDSFTPAVQSFLESQHQGRKVFISYENRSEPGFDVVLKKPFLPSQVITLIEETKLIEEPEVEEEEPVIFPLNEEDVFVEEDQVPEEGSHETEAPSIFPLTSEENKPEEVPVEENALPAVDEVLPGEEQFFKEKSLSEEESAPEEETASQTPAVLDSREIEKIKGLLDMDEEEPEPFEDLIPVEILEERKVEVIKEHLIADGLEIIPEEEIVESLGTKKKDKKKKKKYGPFSKEEMEALEKAFKDELFNLKPKKIKKLLKGKRIELKLKLKDRN